MPGKWTLAVMMEDNNQESECTIPTVWLDMQAQTVRWPLKNSSTAIESLKVPSKGWGSYPLVKIKHQSDEKKACDEYDETSDPGSDSDEIAEEAEDSPKQDRKRARKPNQKYSQHFAKDFQTDSEESSSLVQRLPKPPKTPKNKSDAPKPSSCTPKASTSKTPSLSSPIRTPSSALRTSIDEDLLTPSLSQHLPPPLDGDVTKKLDTIHKGIFTLGKQMLRMTTMMLQLQAERNIQAGAASGVPFFNTTEEIFSFDPSPEERQELLLQLLTVGGCNLQKGVSLVMSKLISIRARSSMNMEGKGNQGKAAFGTTTLYSIIKDALVQFFKVSEADVYKRVQDHLRNQPGLVAKADARKKTVPGAEGEK